LLGSDRGGLWRDNQTRIFSFVNKDGSVNQVQLTKSTGYADLDQAAIDAFSKYKFVPGQEGFTVHNFEFSLKGPAISDVGRLRTTMK